MTIIGIATDQKNKNKKLWYNISGEQKSEQGKYRSKYIFILFKYNSGLDMIMSDMFSFCLHKSKNSNDKNIQKSSQVDSTYKFNRFNI